MKGRWRTRQTSVLCSALGGSWRLALCSTTWALPPSPRCRGCKQLQDKWHPVDHLSLMQTQSVWGQLSPFLVLHRKGVEGREMGLRHPAPSLNDWGISQISVPRFLSGEVDHLAPECNFSIWLGLKQCRISLLNFLQLYFFVMKLSSWRKTGLWNRAFSVSPGCEIQGRAIWQQSPASPAPGRDGSAQPGSCRTLGQWANAMWSSPARFQRPWKRQHKCL